jgi:predicted SAM-dependent methyltransferase
MRILEIGPGTANGKSWIWPDADTVDTAAKGATCNCRWGQEPFPFEDNTYDLVFASHVLEHVPWYRTDAALQEAHRILKPGGEIEIYVPDFAWIVQCYKNKKAGDHWDVYDIKDHWMTWVNGRIFTYGEDATELKSAIRPLVQTQHKATFDADYLWWRLDRNKFKSAHIPPKRRHGTAHPEELRMVATK